MNPLPILALGIIASGYTYATRQLDALFAEGPAPAVAQISAQIVPGAGTDFSATVFHMPGAAIFDAFSPYCDVHAVVEETLSHDFAEKAVDTSLQANGLTMVLYASDLMGTWTLVHKGDDGVSCIVSSGSGWTADASPEDVLAQANLSS